MPGRRKVGMLPGILQSPFLELKEDPGGIPVEVISPGVVPEEIDFSNRRITEDKLKFPRFLFYKPAFRGTFQGAK